MKPAASSSLIQTCLLLFVLTVVFLQGFSIRKLENELALLRDDSSILRDQVRYQFQTLNDSIQDVLVSNEATSGGTRASKNVHSADEEPVGESSVPDERVLDHPMVFLYDELPAEIQRQVGQNRADLYLVVDGERFGQLSFGGVDRDDGLDPELLRHGQDFLVSQWELATLREAAIIELVTTGTYERFPDQDTATEFARSRFGKGETAVRQIDGEWAVFDLRDLIRSGEYRDLQSIVDAMRDEFVRRKVQAVGMTPR